MSQETTRRRIGAALDAGEGILHLKPTWVPRTFAHPGRRLKLAKQDLYALGVDRGGIDERWFASTVPADNGPATPPDEGLSYVHDADGGLFLLRDAVALEGERIVGADIYGKYGRWPVFCKFFDNMGSIPHHLHQRAEDVRALGRESKPEAYYFPPQLNTSVNDFPFTFFGVTPDTTRADVRDCLERWNEGDNGILDLAVAYRLKPGTGWLVPAGILHGPGSLCTYEVQWASDVLAMFQNIVEDRPIGRELLIKDVPAEHADDLDYLVNLVDWEANIDPAFKEHHYLEPIDVSGVSADGVQDRWVIYGKIDDADLFSARELTLEPGARCVLQDNAASGVYVIQGTGNLGVHRAAAPAVIRFGEATQDEFFISAEAAQQGVVVENSGVEPFVLLRYMGPGASPNMPSVGDHRKKQQS